MVDTFGAGRYGDEVICTLAGADIDEFASVGIGVRMRSDDVDTDELLHIDTLHKCVSFCAQRIVA